MTIAELDRWAISSDWGSARREWLRLYLERFVVIPYTRELCLAWAEVTTRAEANGRRIECADAWIAATAMLYNIPLVTHNGSDFAGVPGLHVISR